MSADPSPHKTWLRLRVEASRCAYIAQSEEQSLIARANAGDQRALLTLVDSHRRLVVDIAARYKRSEIPAQDLVGEGMVGLLEAIRRFDPAQQVRLSTYAKWWIRARVRAYTLANRSAVALPSTRAARVAIARLSNVERQLTHTLGRAPTRAELAEALNIPEPALAEVVVALSSRDVRLDGDDKQDANLEPRSAGANPEQAVTRMQEVSSFEAKLCDLVAELSERERLIFDAQLSEGERTLQEVGKALGITRQRASQIAANVREKCRKSFAGVSAA